MQPSQKKRKSLSPQNNRDVYKTRGALPRVFIIMYINTTGDTLTAYFWLVIMNIGRVAKCR